MAGGGKSRLEFEKISQTCGFSERQVALAKAVVIGRLVEPGSELATWQWFRENSALPELSNDDISELLNEVRLNTIPEPEHKKIIEALNITTLPRRKKSIIAKLT